MIGLVMILATALAPIETIQVGVLGPGGRAQGLLYECLKFKEETKDSHSAIL